MLSKIRREMLAKNRGRIIGVQIAARILNGEDVDGYMQGCSYLNKDGSICVASAAIGDWNRDNLAEKANSTVFYLVVNNHYINVTDEDCRILDVLQEYHDNFVKYPDRHGAKIFLNTLDKVIEDGDV